MNPWEVMPPRPDYYMYHPYSPSYPAVHPQAQASFAGQLFDHPLYQVQMPEQKYPPYSPMPVAPYPAYGQQKNTGNMFIQSFKNEDGSLNINKALDTAGMMMNTVSQLGSIVKGVSGWLKV
ncbi:YppG family protein [Bacillus sp. REN10]|uniref:YppG family protein n=1 Tax=Bacillus sp. REN10 TaxID=2782541 RepID=UPI00193C1C69|nr:YppG family protein [Bacillus sp. REN10]